LLSSTRTCSISTQTPAYTRLQGLESTCSDASLPMISESETLVFRDITRRSMRSSSFTRCRTAKLRTSSWSPLATSRRSALGLIRSIMVSSGVTLKLALMLVRTRHSGHLHGRGP